MEPVNEMQAQQTENFSKANGANLLGCPGCGSRACAQANCWRVFHPPFSRCRACFEKCEDVIYPQFCFFNSQFLNPFFHNGSVPQNYCCNHGGTETNSNSEPNTEDQMKCECVKPGGMATSQKMKKKPVRGKISERNTALENETSHFSQYQNQRREKSRWNHQPCECKELHVWSSNSFIIPIVSYCVLWHPQNPSQSHSNYSCSQMENLNAKNEDADGDSFSNSESSVKYGRDLDVEKECGQDCSEDGLSKKETDREQNISSSSFLSLHSSVHNGNKIFDIKKENSRCFGNAESDANSEEEAGEELQIRRGDWSSNSQSHLSAKSNENILSNGADYCGIDLAGNESRKSSTAASEYNMKTGDVSAEAEEVEDQTECLDESSEEGHTQDPRKSSLESLEEKNSVYNGADTEFSNKDNLKTKPKILIKNFTVTNRVESAFQGTQTILAAGGDLGGDNCVGFKVRIESEGLQLDGLPPDAANGNSEIKSIPLKVLEKPGSPIEKAIVLKSARGSRTGIARLIQDSKSRESTKDESKEFDCNDSKRRRFQKRETSKFQNDKFGIALQQKTGLEKQNLTRTANKKLPNKEKTFSPP